MTSIVEITEENFYQVIKLELQPEQELFVAPNVRSLAECYLYRNDNDVFPYAICNDDTVIGFALLYSDDDEKSMTVWRIMIDKNHQGKGYGKQAMLQLEELIKSYKKYTRLYTSYTLENVNAKKLYWSLGYKDDKLNEYNEMVVIKELEI